VPAVASITNSTVPEGDTLVHTVTLSGAAEAATTYSFSIAGITASPDDIGAPAFSNGVTLNDGPTRPAEADRIAPPDLWPRDPPVRFRKTVPDCWLRLTLREGRNRQVRRMTAAVGHPTLRLVRWSVGEWTVAGIGVGEWRKGAR